MKSLLLAVTLLIAANAHASAVARGDHGHHAGAANNGASLSGISATSAVSSSVGSNGRYSLVDEYQPWPQSEMQQFAKARWTPYDGK